MNFSAIGVVDDVAVGDDAISIDEEAAAARELLAARIEGFDGDGGGLDAANEFRKQVLRSSSADRLRKAVAQRSKRRTSLR